MMISSMRRRLSPTEVTLLLRAQSKSSDDRSQEPARAAIAASAAEEVCEVPRLLDALAVKPATTEGAAALV
jgi:hypothetical protein